MVVVMVLLEDGDEVSHHHQLRFHKVIHSAGTEHAGNRVSETPAMKKKSDCF
jgi:hypothetical protein